MALIFLGGSRTTDSHSWPMEFHQFRVFCCDENALNAPSQELFGIGKCTVFTCMGVQCFDDFIVVMS